MFLTNVAPFTREINRLSNCIRFIAKKHCYNKEIFYQTPSSLLFVLCLIETLHHELTVECMAELLDCTGDTTKAVTVYPK